MINSETKPWWNHLVAGDSSAGSSGSIHATGDVMIGVVGAGTHTVPVGKTITQQIYELVGPPAPDDKQLIRKELDRVVSALTAQQGRVDAVRLQMAENYLQLLRGELMKTGKSEIPSASTITLVGNWLLDNVPQLVDALASLFATPAAGRVIGKAGERAATWVKQRFATQT